MTVQPVRNEYGKLKDSIVEYVYNHQDDNGYLTKNKVQEELTPDIGGSRTTYTEAFVDLLDPLKDGRLKREHIKKKIFVF